MLKLYYTSMPGEAYKKTIGWAKTLKLTDESKCKAGINYIHSKYFGWRWVLTDLRTAAPIRYCRSPFRLVQLCRKIRLAYTLFSKTSMYQEMVERFERFKRGEEGENQ